MNQPVRAANNPYPTTVQVGKSYYWCSCGQSKNQPFCDASHKGTGFSPVKYEAKADETVYFCGCKQTKNSPLCDGSHSK